MPEGNNRVILATDGDFNVGVSSDAELVRAHRAAARRADVFLTVLGFGTGNVKDSKMEKLADKGNGNYATSTASRRRGRCSSTEMGGTLLTVAKDVKLQVEFNPARVGGVPPDRLREPAAARTRTSRTTRRTPASSARDTR